MGSCFSADHSRQLTRVDSGQKSDYNKLILEHLEKNKENFEIIAKSISTLSAVNINSLNTPASIVRSSPIIESCGCKCNCRSNTATHCENNETIIKPKSAKLNKKPIITNFSKANIRSINLLNSKTDNKHKRYVIEVSDSYYSDIKNSAHSSSDMISTDNNHLYRSYAKDLNKKMNKMTKFKSRTQNEINCKNCDNNHYYDEINHLSYLDCSTNSRSRRKTDRKVIGTLENGSYCKQCLRNTQEIMKLAAKNKSYSSNSIRFKGLKSVDSIIPTSRINKEIKLNKSETINCGNFCENKKINFNDVEDFENYDTKEDLIEKIIINSNKKLIKQQSTKKSDKILNEYNETSSLSSILYHDKKISCQKSILTHANVSEMPTNEIMSSSSTESIIDLNLSVANSTKSFSSSKTLVQFEKMQNITDSDPVEEVKLKSDESSPVLAVAVATNTEKLKLQNVIDSVGFLLFPSSKFVNIAFKELLMEFNLWDLFQQTFKTEFVNLFANPDAHQLYSPPNERFIEKSIAHLFAVSKTKTEQKTDLRFFVKKLGHQYFKHLFTEYEKPLLSIGGTMQSFFNNLSSLHESLINHAQFGPRFLYLNDKYTGFAPSFRADENTKSDAICLNIYTIQEKKTPFLNNFYLGLIEGAAKLIWDLDVHIDKMKNTELNFDFAKFDDNLYSFVLGYKVTLKNPAQLNHFISAEINNSFDFNLSADIFKTTFPFTILLDRSLNIVQVGDSLVRSLGQAILNGHGCHIFTYFSIEEPKLNEYSFDSLLLNQNMNFKLKMKSVDNKTSQMKDMEIKGSIIYENETDFLLFLGSPSIQSLEELTDRGMYISDIPIHDAVRDIILVGEQTKAQEGLKIRMEKLKKSILKAHEDIEVEKQKNIELLNMIFPSEIAEKLWMGEKVNGRNVENVTLLYSDIVGFTSICSLAEPIEIVKMLKNIYTEFDNFCGLVDVYKIETIGDAYIVAAGLHKSSKYHAQRAAWMSLLMIEASSKHLTNKNEKIRMRIGLHTGEVLAGIVGIKQPRYCLFGNNCTITNKFESTSEENRIHVSPVTKKLLDSIQTFEMESRSSDFLPENWTSSSNEKENTWFLNGYKNRYISKDAKCIDHVKAALLELDESI